MRIFALAAARWFGIPLVLVAVAAVVAKVGADDPVKVAPEIYKVLLDNPHARVLDVHLKPGEKSPMHSHPGYIVYHFNPGKVRFTSPEGKTSEAEFQTGQTVWHDAETHAVENIGNTESHVLNIELKTAASQNEAQVTGFKEHAAAEHQAMTPTDLKWQPGPPSLPAGAQVTMLEGDLQKPGPFTVRAKFPADYKIPPHFHPGDEHLTVISGTFHVGMGDQLDPSKGKELPTGSFAVMPAGMRHYAWTTEETIVQVHGVGPWGITYVNAADDPQKK